MSIEIAQAKLAASPELSGELFRAKKNALSGEAQDAFGSPPPELPTYMVILCPFGRGVNVTFVMQGLQMSTMGHARR
jgi:hypothetical protein